MEWLISLIVPALITVITLIITNRVQQKRLPHQINVDKADSNSKTMEAYERVVERLNIVERDNIELKKSINGVINLNIQIPMGELFLNGSTTITGTAHVIRHEKPII